MSSPEGTKNVIKKGEDNYYLKKKKRILRQFNLMLQKMRPYLASRFGEEFTANLIPELLLELEGIIPKLPDVGGKKNLFIKEIVLSGYALSFYQVMNRHKIPLHEIGSTLYGAFEFYLNTLPKLLRRLMGMWNFSSFNQRKREKGAEKYNQKAYPNDYVYDYVKGNGEEFDFGIDIRECAILNFYRSLGIEKFTPYLCITDYCMCKSFYIGFSRTSTLAFGGTKCDFRFKKGGETAEGWPPEALVEWKK